MSCANTHPPAQLHAHIVTHIMKWVGCTPGWAVYCKRQVPVHEKWDSVKEQQCVCGDRLTQPVLRIYGEIDFSRGEVCVCVLAQTHGEMEAQQRVDQNEGGLSTPLGQPKIQHTFHSIPSWPQPALGDKHPCSALFLTENSPLRACNEWLSTPPRTWWSTWSAPVVMTSLWRSVPTPPWAAALIRVRLSWEGRGQTLYDFSCACYDRTISMEKYPQTRAQVNNSQTINGY